ncbi:MAG: flagellar basal body P-ring formation chaperone FlgA [Pseudomonadota bacterium]
MSVNTLTLSCGGALLWLWAASAMGLPDDGMQPLATVRRVAESALRRELDPALTGVTLSAMELDARLRVPACPTTLDTSTTLPRGNQTRVIVRVSCKAPANWNINVPVDIRRETSVLVLRRAMARGESIGAADVNVQNRTLAGLASPYFSKVSELEGRVTRRPLPEGTAITAEAMNAALLIHRGQSVTLTSGVGGIEVQAPGLAMADAAANQRVRVQNLNSLKIVEGVADTEGVVRVGR